MDLAQSIATLCGLMADKSVHLDSLRAALDTAPPDIHRLLDRLDERGSLEHKHQARESRLMVEAFNALQQKNDEMLHDLDTARKIQQRLLPQEEEMAGRMEFAAAGHYQSMDRVGGDLYDVMRIGRNSHGFLMADVSGHGLPSALITALVKIAFRTKAHWGSSPAEVAEAVNRELNPILSDLDYYVTAFFGILNLEDGAFRHVNCGHHPAYLVRPAHSLPPAELTSPGRFLGIFDSLGAEDRVTILAPGDSLFFYTDGLVEGRNYLDEEYTHSRLTATLAKGCARWSDLPAPRDPTGLPQHLVDTVRKDLDYFLSGAPLKDDLTLLSAVYLAPSGT